MYFVYIYHLIAYNSICIKFNEGVDDFMNEKLLWFNDKISYLFHANIVEYDMKAMSVSISEKYKLLDEETIKLLKLLPKDQRTKKVGLIQRDDKTFSERLISCELETRRKFLELNGLDESNVLSLHSDACIFNSKKIIIDNIDGVEFKHANTWSSYIKYKNIEMFFDNGVITYKGIPKDMLNQHTLGIHKYLCTVFDKLENYDTSIIEFLSIFQTKYLQDKLPDYYYIPFGKTGNYKMTNLTLLSFIANVAINEIRSW